MTETTALTPYAQVREELAPMKAEFGNLLPSHITADKFAQVCITAIENNPDLLRADRQSFKVACLNAATDGLLPDKREGAFVIFNTEIEVRQEGRAAVTKVKVPLVQWMPMITGILKKAYQTDKVSSIAVEMVHKNDVYRRTAGDNAEIVHEPLDFGDRGEIVGGYAIIRMRDGGIYREVMDLAQIKSVQAVSRARSGGPWFTFWDEMAKKTILRRMLKRVPLSADVDRVLARDDVFYDMKAEARSLALNAPETPTLPPAAMFSDRVAHRRQRPRAEPVETGSDQATAPGETGTAEESVPDETALVQAISVIRAAADITALAEADVTARELATTDEERAWVAETVLARQRELAPADDEPFVLTAVISSATGLRTYEDANLWRDDLLNKISVATGDALKKFWAVNFPFVLSAGEEGFDEHADRVLDAAKAKGLTTEQRA